MNLANFDIVVIGGGHAGIEAAWAAARLGAKTALITLDTAAIGRMSCNPAIGGIGKGQMVREIDALGGLMGLLADQTGIQFRMLNRRKGPAVWAPRCQSDREAYARAAQRMLSACPNLTLIRGSVESIETKPMPAGQRADAWGAQAARCVSGVRLADGQALQARAVVVTSGTFLRALMHCGTTQTPGGRIGEAAANGLSHSLAALGLELGRLKTGTPPRLARDSIDYARLSPQLGDDPPTPFSFMTQRLAQPQEPCWITFTNPAVHALIRDNLERAPMYSGQIQSHGPRYCPSIEDKVVRFADKERHQLFLEPEGRASDRVYVNGISTSLPQDVQAAMLARIEGLEHARVLQWGYAVEYDFVPPQQTQASLMTKAVRGLLLAGQINGTSGYEEAAAQGIVAGINAARFAAGHDPFILRRSDAYIGVMIDDLVTRGVLEPYRMFTSRAEHRMHLRYDNADERLTPIGRELGLVDSPRWERFERRTALRTTLLQSLKTLKLAGESLYALLRRPEEDGERFLNDFQELAPFRTETDVWASALVAIKYEGYLARQERAIEQFEALESRPIPAGFDFASIPHLRHETRQRWRDVSPRTIGQAARVSGVRPTDVALLLVSLSTRA